MIKRRMALSIFWLLLLVGCGVHEEPMSISSLTRVDVTVMQPDGSDGETIVLADQETVNQLRSLFAAIQWEYQVKAEMVRREDVQATLFFELDPNMPEKLAIYQIWFEANGIATVIHGAENGYGRLTKEQAKQLQAIVFHNEGKGL
ncbi:hypothetical protein [Lysinibacillus piscis]|uniref:Lipoprotein n=1 Tax=Lysinibacillus piscis TaxID=2518931 RepID=A0ABQ5NL82_9BACI|nr:hypothetical protein [Lysinibacillus sp. KH24]GLC89109.1 hypothetical protein LYSBPC_22360 [Lysinibacillus sp. KH24]